MHRHWNAGEQKGSPFETLEKNAKEKKGSPFETLAKNAQEKKEVRLKLWRRMRKSSALLRSSLAKGM